MNSINKKYVFTTILIFVINILFLPFVTYLYGGTKGEILRNLGFAVFYSLGLVFLILYSYNTKQFDYDNLEHPRRFLSIFSISFILSMFFPLIDDKGWVFLTVAIALSLFSNTFIGLYSFSGLLMYSIILSKESNEITFFVYFLAASVGIMLFKDIDYNFRVNHSIFISSFVLFVLEAFGIIMLANEALTAEVFIIPIVNICINAIALFWSLKYFSEAVVNKNRNKYLEINDQGYELMQRIKDASNSEYFRSIHTAYLCDRISKETGCNENICKCLAYYHRILSALSINLDDAKKIFIENDFPTDAYIQLIDFLNKKNKLISKESGIVFLSDKLISSIQDTINNDKKAKINYSALIEELFESDEVKKTLQDNDLSYRDIKICKKIMLKEKLYYDFLR